jgi:hypothetical protein
MDGQPSLTPTRMTRFGHVQFENGAAQTDHFVAFRGPQIPVLMGRSTWFFGGRRNVQ